MEAFAISVAVLFLAPGVLALGWAARTLVTAAVGGVARLRMSRHLRRFVTDTPVDSTSVWLSPASARSVARAVGPHTSLAAGVAAVVILTLSSAYCWPLLWGLGYTLSSLLGGVA